MTYNIKLQAFEGPFDLLFHLIEKNEIDIYDIPINEVTYQYMEYIKTMEILDLEITSEFLVMAATLLEIKSKMLLPVEVADHIQLEFEELDPRHELVRRLLEYKKYKMAAEVFKEKEDVSKKMYFKPREELIFTMEEDQTRLLESIGIKDLIIALEKLLAGKPMRAKERHTFHQMQREAFTIDEKMEDILDRLKENTPLHFSRLFADIENRNEIITIFLALLELIKLKTVSVKQEMSFTEIEINLRNIS